MAEAIDRTAASGRVTVERVVRLLLDARWGTGLAGKTRWLLTALAARAEAGHAGDALLTRQVTALTGLSPEEIRGCRRQAEAAGWLTVRHEPGKQPAEWRLTLPEGD